MQARNPLALFFKLYFRLFSLTQASCEEHILEIHSRWIEEHLLQFQRTESHKYFMKQMKVLQPVWVEAFEKSGLKADFVYRSCMDCGLYMPLSQFRSVDSKAKK